MLDRGVLVGEPPNAWLMRDTNGDLKMDTKESVTDLYGRREARVEQNANDFFWAMDNWMHTADGDISLRLKDGKFEVRRTLTRGEWGVTQDDAGRIYRNTNESSVHVDYVPTPYFTRNPALVRARAAATRRCATRRTRSIRSGRCGRIRAPIARISSASIVPTARSRIHGGLRAADLSRRSSAGRALRQHVRRRAGRQPREPDRHRGRRQDAARRGKAYERGEFLASTDERFRPVYLSNAPDGTLYIVDMYRGVIQQRADITEYLRDHIIKRKLEQPTGWDGSTASCTRPRSAIRRRRRRSCRRRSWSSACRIRTAGGATRRSGCSSSAATSAWRNR